MRIFLVLNMRNARSLIVLAAALKRTDKRHSVTTCVIHRIDKHNCVDVLHSFTHAFKSRIVQGLALPR